MSILPNVRSKYGLDFLALFSSASSYFLAAFQNFFRACNNSDLHCFSFIYCIHLLEESSPSENNGYFEKSLALYNCHKKKRTFQMTMTNISSYAVIAWGVYNKKLLKKYLLNEESRFYHSMKILFVVHRAKKDCSQSLSH